MYTPIANELLIATGCVFSFFVVIASSSELLTIIAQPCC